MAGSSDKPKIDEYDIGSMHEIVYDVYGGFEDWVYGGSWEQSNLQKSCRGYNKDIVYDDKSLRGFVFLVEAGN